MMDEVKSLILEHTITFRFLLFLCACSYVVILYYWLKPNLVQVKAGVMAILMQFWIGLLCDHILVRLGFWTYHDQGFMALNVPIDLHIDWSILWGLGICWLFDRWPGKGAILSKFFIYILAWTVFTLLFDVMIAQWMVFLEDYSSSWWIADFFQLFIVQGLTVWFYTSIGKKSNDVCDLPFLPVISPYIRSLLYLSFFISLFFIYIPDKISYLISYFGIHVTTYHFDFLAYPLLFLAVAIGGWATHEFARKGDGTPIPLDDPHFLVMSGPYLFLRNPMQTSGILLTLSVLLFNFHWFNLFYLLDVILVVWLIFERFESLELQQRYGDAFRNYIQMVPLWTANVYPKKLGEKWSPRLFIDSECPICVSIVDGIKKLDFADNIQIKSLSDVFQLNDPHLETLARSKSSMILVEPRVGEGDDLEFLYSVKGRATLRLFGYMPFPLCFLAAFEGLPGFPLLADIFYSLFARMRCYF